MRRDLLSYSFSALVLSAALFAALSGCPGGGAGIGASCGGNDDCADALQCLNSRCVPRCERAPDCGDGYGCQSGLCVVAHGGSGDPCHSEADCVAGLSCQINGAEVDDLDRLVASCVMQNPTGHTMGSECDADADCRNGTCELGHCVDLCRDTVDCPAGTECATVPRVVVDGELFSGCLPASGTLTWTIPVTSPSAEVLLPVPSNARAAGLVMSVDDPNQKVGVQSALDSCGCTRYTVPCPFLIGPSEQSACTDIVAANEFYSRPPAGGGGGGSSAGSNICSHPTICNEGGPDGNHIRHLPTLGRSVMLIPSIPKENELKTGAYQIEVSSFWPDNSTGSAIPRVTAVVRLGKIGDGTTLELHFFFLDLGEHPCAAMTENKTLDADLARRTDGFFQTTYLGELRKIFSDAAGIAIDDASYENITDRHALDGLDLSDVGSLLSLGRYAKGINVFFVRSLSPIGTEVIGPSPGPVGLAGTPESGIAIAMDTLCYRDWKQVARLTAHELARYMGLYHNVEPRDPGQAPEDLPWQDLVSDSDTSSANLMYFSTRLGTALSPGQADALNRSPVLK